jgi:ATP-dependent protease ClpP protease subunit
MEMPKAMAASNPHKFWNFVQKNDSEAELTIYSTIASEQSWWEDEVTPQAFYNELADIGDVANITVRINSGGGDVFAATAIYALLKDHSAFVTVKVDGIAASAATIIMMAGDKITAPAGAQIMIHNPLAVLFGYFEGDDLRKRADMLDTAKTAIMEAYTQKTGLSEDELSDLMNETTWMTAREAKEKGFVDEIMFEPVDSAVSNDGRFLIVNSIPFDVKKLPSAPSIQNRNGQKVNLEEVFDVEIKNKEELKAKYPTLCNELVTDAINNERERIKGIEEIAAHITPELLNKAKFDEPMTAQELAFQAMKNDAHLSENYVQQRQEELHQTQSIGGGNPDDQKNEENIAIQSILNHMKPARRKEAN